MTLRPGSVPVWVKSEAEEPFKVQLIEVISLKPA